MTIFVSTHFMNEAMRCDRISLMHAGKVLAVGTPRRLMESKNETTLEAAFISYMREAHADETEGSPEFADLSNIVEPQAPSGRAAKSIETTGNFVPHDRGIEIMRLYAYTLRETKEILRDPIRLGFAFIGSTILLFIFSYGITTDVEDVEFAVLDQDRTPISRAYVQAFQGSRYFQERQPIKTLTDLEARLAANEVTVAIEIPPSFGQDLTRGGSTEVSAWIDGANTMRAATIEGYVAGVHERFLEQLADTTGRNADSRNPSGFTVRFLYNPTFESIYAIGPAVPAMLLILFPAILMAVSVVREKEIGTITNLYVTPSTRFEFLIG
ncbi:MAG: ABC transporter permease, partial [Pseudomonadota bacterium]